jgi:hypothetical protein
MRFKDALLAPESLYSILRLIGLFSQPRKQQGATSALEIALKAGNRLWSRFSCQLVMTLTLSPVRWIRVLRGLKANSLIRRGSGNLNSLIFDQNSLFRSLGKSPKKPNGHAGFLARRTAEIVWKTRNSL